MCEIYLNMTGKFVSATVLAVAKEASQARAAELWAATGLKWDQFLEEGADASAFVKDNVSCRVF